MTIKSKYFFILLVVGNSVIAQDLKLWYNKPATKWVEALPLGNGRIGAMIFGGVEQDHIQFNEETLWTGEPRNYSRPGAYRYLDSIRQLLFEGKQKEANALAEKEFMGLKSNDGNKGEWLKKILRFKDAAEGKFYDDKWKTMTVPSYDGWEAVGFAGLDGAVWVQTYFSLPASWMGKELILDLNRISHHDLTYVNGKLIGSRQDNEPRRYTISTELLHSGRNNIAIQIINYADKGGVLGYKDTTTHIGIYPVNAESSKISLNGQWKYYIQDENPPAIGVYQASYQPFGDLFLNFKNTGEVTNYRRELDLENAVATTSYSQKGVDYRRECFVSQPDQVMAINLTASKQASISLDVSLTSPHRNFIVKHINANTITLSVRVKNGALKGSSYLNVGLTGGVLVTDNNRFSIRGADRVTLYLSAATNYNNYHDITADPAKKCLNALTSIKGKTYEQIKGAHIKEYQQYFNTFSISLGKSENERLPTDERIEKFASSNDPSFVALYLQYGRYLLISSSRPGTRPANLQGIWNDQLNPPWGSKYTTNINLEMNYWPAEALNLSPMHEPLFHMLKELAVAGKKTAKDHYNAPGWVLHHNTDLWRGTAPINAADHGIWVTGGAWLCRHLWAHYLFTQDKDFLQRTAYPIMKEAALFFNTFLIKDPKTGYLISTPSNSPEQGGLVAGPTMDHQVIRGLFNNVIAASQFMNVDSTLRNALKEKIKQIAPNKIGKYGQLLEWMDDVDDTTNKHRHISHLWAVHPGNEINWDDTPELMKEAQQSLFYRGDAATGWSLGWKINCWARFKDGDHAFRLIQMLMSPSKNDAGSYPNLFDAHPPFQIDGNFGGAAGIGELILQSHTKFIDILPALPAALPDGDVKGYCARGGFVFDIKWNAGKLQELTVLSKAGQPLQMRYNGKVINIPTTKNTFYKFNAALDQK